MKAIPIELLKSLKKHRDAIAKERDALRELLEDFQQIEDCATAGLESLDNAIETFSEQL